MVVQLAPVPEMWGRRQGQSEAESSHDLAATTAVAEVAELVMSEGLAHRCSRRKAYSVVVMAGSVVVPSTVAVAEEWQRIERWEQRQLLAEVHMCTAQQALRAKERS